MKGSVKTPVAKAAAAKDILGCLITMPYKVNEVYKAVPFNANVPGEESTFHILFIPSLHLLENWHGHVVSGRCESI